MANKRQLERLRQGVETWNIWRDKSFGVQIDLVKASLRKVDLTQADLHGANFEAADLNEADLSGAFLRGANLVGADLRGANLSDANLVEADLRDTKLVGANLSRADLREANLWRTDLGDTTLREADLGKATLIGTVLTGTSFLDVVVDDTVFGNLDLSEAIGLEHTHNSGPSSISADTFSRSKGKISNIFLQGCGLSDWEIEMVKLYNPSLNKNERNKILYELLDLQASQATQISPLFISYSHGDTDFVNKIDKFLTQKGVRFWRDIHDLRAGRIEKQIDQAISQDRTVLLVLSEHSLNSDWVEHEVRTARELEKQTGRDCLCPITLDDSWKASKWEKRIMEQVMKYSVLDFSEWQDDTKFDEMFRRLISGLQLFYKE